MRWTTRRGEYKVYGVRPRMAVSPTPGPAMATKLNLAIRTIRIGTLVLLGFGASVGCKNREGGLFSGRDPLIGGEKIPPQGVPIPGKDGYGSNGTKDPLLKGGTASRDPREPYRPSPEITTAALAGTRPQDDYDPLRMEDRRPSSTKTTNTPAPSPAPAGTNSTTEQMLDDLRRVGGRVYAPIKLQNGDYEFRCALPRNESGAMTTFTAVGPTANAAIRDVIEQVRAESKR